MRSWTIGALMGLLIGGPATLLSWRVVTSAVNRGSLPIIGWIFCWTLLGAVLGVLLLRSRAGSNSKA